MYDEVGPRAVRAPRRRAARRRSIRLVDADEAYALFPPVYERIRVDAAGDADADRALVEGTIASPTPKSWRRGASQKFYAAIELDGAGGGATPPTASRSRVGGRPAASGEVQVIEAFATSPAAERELWRFLHGIDLMIRVDVLQRRSGVAAPADRPRLARARDAARRRALAALRRPRRRAEGALVPARRVRRLEVTRRALPLERGPLSRRARAPAGPRTRPISRSTSPISRPRISARSTSTGSCTRAAPTSGARAPPRRRRCSSAPTCRPFCPEVF